MQARWRVSIVETFEESKLVHEGEFFECSLLLAMRHAQWVSDECGCPVFVWDIDTGKCHTSRVPENKKG